MHIPQLAGKQFVIRLDGQSRTIGEIVGAKINGERTALALTVALTDEEAAGIFGAAADKAAAAPLTESEIEDIVHGDEWTGQVSA